MRLVLRKQIEAIKDIRNAAGQHQGKPRSVWRPQGRRAKFLGTQEQRVPARESKINERRAQPAQNRKNQSPPHGSAYASRRTAQHRFTPPSRHRANADSDHHENNSSDNTPTSGREKLARMQAKHPQHATKHRKNSQNNGE